MIEKLISTLYFRAHRDIGYVLDTVIDFIKNDCLYDPWMTLQSTITSGSIQNCGLIDSLHDTQFKGRWAAHLMFSLIKKLVLGTFLEVIVRSIF